jgi:ABC-type branched-subunit amino acid transport system substrate-binding protein
VGLTGLAAVVVVEGAELGVLLPTESIVMAPAVIWTSAVVPPAPGFVAVFDDLFGLTITTLPAAPAADEAAALIAAVERSPATAVNAS